MEMSCAAEGVYMRCLLLQTERTNLPQNVHKLALLLRKPVEELEKVWHEVEPHFETEVVDGETRLYNARHREVLKESVYKSNKYSKAAKKREQAKLKHNCATTPTQSDQDCALRASVSDSVSDSVSASSKTRDLKASSKAKAADSDHLGKSDAKFCEFYDLYPRKINRKDAYAAYLKHVSGDDDHADLIRATRAAADGLFSNRSLDRIPYPSVWINARNWQDDTADLSAPQPQIHNGFVRSGSHDPVQAYRDRIEKFDPASVKPLTPEQIAEDEQEELGF